MFPWVSKKPGLVIVDGEGKTLVESPKLNASALETSFSQDGRYYAGVFNMGGAKHSLLIWDTLTGKRTTLPAELTREFIILSPDGSRLAARKVLPGRTFREWPLQVRDTFTGQVLFDLEDSENNTRGSTVFSPDGRWLVGKRKWGNQFSLVCWDAATGKVAASVKIPELRAGPVFSRDGRLVVALHSRGREATVWNVHSLASGESTEPVVTLHGNFENVHQLEISPDNRRLMTVGSGVVKLWDLTNGLELLVLRSSSIPVQHAVFSTDGRHIWAGLDKKGRLWGWDATPLEADKGP